MSAIGQGNLEFHKLFRAMRTVAEMMTDRKYQIAHDKVPKTFDEFMQKYVDTVAVDGAGATVAAAPGGSRTKRVVRRDQMTLPCERRMGEQRRLALVFFVPPNGLTTESLKEYRRVAEADLCSFIMFVTASRPNAIMKKTVDLINRSETNLRVQVFEEDALAVNITHHELVPKHTPLEPEEVQAVLQAYALELHQLPRILSSDPVAAYFGLERGQVVRIERKSMSAGIYVAYRQVV